MHLLHLQGHMGAEDYLMMKIPEGDSLLHPVVPLVPSALVDPEASPFRLYTIRRGPLYLQEKRSS